jgi:hypothetical protein
MIEMGPIIRPPIPKDNRFRKVVFRLVNKPAFDYFIMIVIGLNTIVICVDYNGHSEL